MKITITQSTGSDHEWGVTMPPYDGKCQSCERPAGTWMRNKQREWICVKCHYEATRKD